jgi:hypothetical protein
MTHGSGPPPPDDLETDVVLHYIDKAHDSFTSNRTYANRVLVAQTVIALIMIGIVIGAAEGKKFTIGSSDFGIEAWAVLLAGAVFVGLTPGFVIGRLIYNANLAKMMQGWYGCLERRLEARADDTAVPWEIASLVSEAGWASARVYKNLRERPHGGEARKPTLRERLVTTADLVGGPLTFLILFAALPVGAQVFAGVWWWKTVDSAGWGLVVGIGACLLVLITLASVLGAALRLKDRWEQAGVLPLRQRDVREAQPAQAGQRDLL